MDCDTTGVEPDFSLVKFKELVGGGQMTIVNQTIPMALRTLGYGEDADRADRGAHRRARDDRRRARPGRRAPVGLRRGGRRARDLAHGPHQDDGRRPAVHLGRDLQDREPAVRGDGRGHRRRVHAGVALRRQGAGDLPRRLEDRAGAAHRCAAGQGRRRRSVVEGYTQEQVDELIAEAVAAARAKTLAEVGPKRNRMPRERQSITHKFSIAGHEGYITAGMYEDGTLGEIFLTDIGKEGSTLRGLMNCVRDVDLDRAAVRRAAREARREVLLHALRARGHHAEPGDPVRQVDARLHHALARVALPGHRHPGGARHPDPRGPRAQDGRGRRHLDRAGRTPRGPPTAATAATGHRAPWAPSPAPSPPRRAQPPRP